MDQLDVNFEQSPFYSATGLQDTYRPGHVNTPTPAWLRGEILRRLPRLLMGGTEAMRLAAGSGGQVLMVPSNLSMPAGSGSIRTMPSILPRNKGELREEYEVRRDTSVLFSYFEDAIEEHVGRAFHQPPTLLDDVPEFIRGRERHTEEMVDDGTGSGDKRVVRRTETVKAGLWENIDNRGLHGTLFLRNVWRDAECDGITFVLVDTTPGRLGADGRPAVESVAQRQASGRRPYWVHVLASDVIEATPRTVNGTERLAVLRVREREEQVAGAVTYRVRKYYDGLDLSERADQSMPDYLPPDAPERMARWELYEHPQTKSKKVANEQWPLVAAGEMSLSEVPLVEFVFGRKYGFMQAEPALGRLAEANLTQYRIYSDYLALAHKACCPILHRSGWAPDQTDPGNPQNVVSASSLMWSRDAQAKIEWVELHGSSLQRIEASLDRLDTRCKELSLDPVLQRLGTPTATAEGLKASKANSRIEGWMMLLKDAAERCLDYTAQLGDGLAPGNGGSVETNKDLGLLLLGGVDANLLLALSAAVKIDDATLLKEIKRRGILGMDSDIDAIIAAARRQAEMNLRGTPLALGAGRQGQAPGQPGSNGGVPAGGVVGREEAPGVALRGEGDPRTPTV